MKWIRLIADFWLASYLFIALAGACMVMTTGLLCGFPLRVTPLTCLVFFSTLLIYNFHRVSTLFANQPFSFTATFNRLMNYSGLTTCMTITALVGIIITAFYIRLRIAWAFIPLALITYAYSVPVIKVTGKKKRLREILLIKITTVAFVWAFATVTLPLIGFGLDPLSFRNLLLFAGRFLFVFALCIPFEIRDLEQEKRWGNTTLPQLVGVNISKLIGVLALLLFVLSVPAESKAGSFALPLYISAFLSSLLVLFSNEKHSKYYCRVFVDGMMHLQFILLLLFRELS